MVRYEQDQAQRLLDAMAAAIDRLYASGQRGSASCVERARDELDTASAAEIASMIDRNSRP